MAAAIRVVGSHPLLIREVQRILTDAEGLHVSALQLPSALQIVNCPTSLFVLDGCSLPGDLGPLTSRLRAHSAGSKFIVLLAPGPDAAGEKVRLFNWGIDGFVELGERWKQELPRAVQSVLRGQPWVSPEVLLAFVNRAKALLEAQQRRGQFLTAREAQVLQFLMRRLTNKDISSALDISERTVKFHVSNILSKLQIENRHSLSPEAFALFQPTSRP